MAATESLERDGAELDPGSRVQADEVLRALAEARREEAPSDVRPSEAFELRDGKLSIADQEAVRQNPGSVLELMTIAGSTGLEVDDATAEFASSLDLSGLREQPDQLRQAWGRLLVYTERPEAGLRAAQRLGVLELHPMLKDLVGLEESHRWHEGEDAMQHTEAAVAQGSKYELPDDQKLTFMLGVMLHDVGKPEVNHYDNQVGDIVSKGHDQAGVPLAGEFVRSLGMPEQEKPVTALVKRHMWPELNDPDKVTDKKLGDLIRGLEADGTSFEQLIRVSTADVLGRKNPPPEGFPNGPKWLKRASDWRAAEQERAAFILRKRSEAQSRRAQQG